MAIHINEVLPVLDSICEQQQAICDRLHKLIETFKSEPEPVEPTLRFMLKPLDECMMQMKETLSPISPPDDYSASQSES